LTDCNELAEAAGSVVSVGIDMGAGEGTGLEGDIGGGGTGPAGDDELADEAGVMISEAADFGPAEGFFNVEVAGPVRPADCALICVAATGACDAGLNKIQIVAAAASNPRPMPPATKSIDARLMTATKGVRAGSTTSDCGAADTTTTVAPQIGH
jgi:hypothetical protein